MSSGVNREIRSFQTFGNFAQLLNDRFAAREGGTEAANSHGKSYNVERAEPES